MRMTRFLDSDQQVRFGVDLGDGAADLLPIDTSAAGAGLSTKLPRPTGKIIPIAARIAPVVPKNVFCIGLNYAEHAKEGGRPIPENPVIFMKPTTAVTDPGAPIRLPRVCGYEVDFECELAVIIGAPGRDIPKEQALDHVFGYTVANDVSARKWQREGGGGQWIRGKSFDTFCPLGPVIVTAHPVFDGDADIITDPQNLHLKTTLNGQVMQDSSTSDMIFSVADLISFISRDTTLASGTLILTGTPQGVGFARKPPVFFKAGDQVTVEIDRIGQLSNPVVDADATT